jgi:hypothetical protein
LEKSALAAEDLDALGCAPLAESGFLGLHTSGDEACPIVRFEIFKAVRPGNGPTWRGRVMDLFSETARKSCAESTPGAGSGDREAGS